MADRVAEPAMTDDAPLPVGSFAAWLVGMRRALEGGRGSDVPCDGCTACCTSSQFVHIGPDEKDTLAHIPSELLFPAPRLARGNVLLGYDENGRCPMLGDGGCSIYEHRPRTCRTYDCRILPAAGLDLGRDKPAIGSRARRWQFSFPDELEEVQHEAVRAAAGFLRRRADVLPEGMVPADPTQLAVLAVHLHDQFLSHDGETGRTVVVDPDPQAVAAVLASRLRPPAATAPPRR